VALRNVVQTPNLVPAGESAVAVIRTRNVESSGIGRMDGSTGSVGVDVQMVSPRTAPDRALGYQGADVLVWLNPEPERLEEFAQRKAIEEYVRGGGHLVVAVGAEWQRLSGSFLERILPAVPTGAASAPLPPDLFKYGPADPLEPIVLARLRTPIGEGNASSEATPWVVRGRHGFGRVTLLAFDPTLPPFSRMKERKRFWEDLLGLKTPDADFRASPIHIS